VSVLRDVQRVALVALAASVLAAAAVLAFALGQPLRDWFGLTPEHPARVGAGELWLDNARTLLWPLAAAAAVSWWPRARHALDGLLVVILGGNVLLVALALGAYGAPLLRLAPGHYALELLALATAAAAYVDARRARAVRPRALAGCSAATAALLLGAALLEGPLLGFLSPGAKAAP
jgi:hypothetical protein